MVDIYNAAKMVCVLLRESDDYRRSDKATLGNYLYVQAGSKLPGSGLLSPNPRGTLGSQDGGLYKEFRSLDSQLCAAGRKWCNRPRPRRRPPFVLFFFADYERVRNLFDYSEWRYGPDTVGEIQSNSAHVLFKAMNNMFLRTKDGGIRRPIKNLEYLVTSLTTFDATDPRNFVYSLVHIASDRFTPSRCYQKPKGKSVEKEVMSLKVNY